ncbi:MAG TPA: galactose-1-phosphate uridylyltransferase [Methanoculleus sp.]|nr:galactose-1-phosphate uridylyltransferase [Methanoculleus sp.]
MFAIAQVDAERGIVQYRREHLTGLQCRISPERIKRGIGKHYAPGPPAGECPFCPDRVREATPVFEDGTRIEVGESITFPNLYPFAECHTVTVISRDHEVDRFSVRQLSDALLGQIESLRKHGGYASINWNYLPSAGASIPHPHLQGIADRRPSVLAECYIAGCNRYRARHGTIYRDDLLAHEIRAGRYLFGEEIPWIASAVPLGEREVRGLLPVRTLEEAEPYTDCIAEGMREIIDLYRDTGSMAFNASIFFEKPGCDSGFRAFCSMIARINPNPWSTSDSAFMERLHLEPVILTLPEAFAARYRTR